MPRAGIFWAGVQVLRPQEEGTCGSDDHQKRAQVQQAGEGGDKDLGKCDDVRPQIQVQHRPAQTCVFLQGACLFGLLAASHQPLRIKQATKVQRTEHGHDPKDSHPSAARTALPQAAEHHPLRPEARKHPPQAGEQVRH